MPHRAKRMTALISHEFLEPDVVNFYTQEIRDRFMPLVKQAENVVATRVFGFNTLQEIWFALKNDKITDEQKTHISDMLRPLFSEAFEVWYGLKRDFNYRYFPDSEGEGDVFDDMVSLELEDLPNQAVDALFAINRLLHLYSK